MIIIRFTATGVHKSSIAGLSSCACSTPIAIRPNPCLKFLDTVPIREIIVIAFGHCLQVLNPWGKALQQGSTNIPHFPRTAVTDCWAHVFPAQKGTEKPCTNMGTVTRNRCGWRPSASFCSPLNCKNYHVWCYLGNCNSSPAWRWVKRQYTFLLCYLEKSLVLSKSTFH